jgi:hypothetical protein
MNGPMAGQARIQTDPGPQVSRELSILGKEIESLRMAVGDLASRLTVVTREPSEMTSPGGAASPCEHLVPVANSIRDARWCIEAIKEAVFSLQSRLEI